MIWFFLLSGDFIYTVDGDNATITGYSGTESVVVIPSRIEDKTVTGIGPNCFKDVSRVDIPDTVRFIGPWAFNYSKITEITIPASVVELGEWAFHECGSLTTVTFMGSLTHIPEGCFKKCEKIPQIKLPDGLIEIGPWAFQKCYRLVSIEFPETVSVIGEEAFQKCTKMFAMCLPESLTNLSKTAFNDLTSLSYVFTNARYLISNEYFNASSYLNSITVSSKVENPWLFVHNYQYLISESYQSNITITSGGFVMSGKTLLGYYGDEENLVFPSDVNVETIWLYAFANTEVRSVEFPDSLVRMMNCAFFRALNVFSLYLGKNLVSIESRAFEECHSLVNITIPDSVETIGDSAFYRCTCLHSINIPENILDIGSNLFHKCYSLEYVYINAKALPDVYYEDKSIFKNLDQEVNCYSNVQGLKKFGGVEVKPITFVSTVTKDEHYFYQSKEDNTVALILCFNPTENPKFDSSVTSIGPHSFAELNIDTFEVPDVIKVIEKGAFSDSTLKQIRFSSGLREIHSKAFQGCNYLDNISMPDTLIDIGNNAFSECRSLKTVRMSGTVKNIGKTAFEYSAIESITLSDTLKTVGDKAFYECDNLLSIVMPASITHIGTGCFSRCSVLRVVDIKSSITEIPEDCFSDCASLSSITFSSTISAIREYAFQSCYSLVFVVIPSNIWIIEDNAFSRCTSMEQIHICAMNCSISTLAFKSCHSSLVVFFHKKARIPFLPGVTYRKIKNIGVEQNLTATSATNWLFIIMVCVAIVVVCVFLYTKQRLEKKLNLVEDENALPMPLVECEQEKTEDSEGEDEVEIDWDLKTILQFIMIVIIVLVSFIFTYASLVLFLVLAYNFIVSLAFSPIIDRYGKETLNNLGIATTTLFVKDIISLIVFLPITEILISFTIQILTSYFSNLWGNLNPMRMLGLLKKHRDSKMDMFKFYFLFGLCLVLLIVGIIGKAADIEGCTFAVFMFSLFIPLFGVLKIFFTTWQYFFSEPGAIEINEESEQPHDDFLNLIDPAELAYQVEWIKCIKDADINVFRHRKFNWRQIIGVLMGVLAIVVIVLDWHSAGSESKIISRKLKEAKRLFNDCYPLKPAKFCAVQKQSMKALERLDGQIQNYYLIIARTICYGFATPFLMSFSIVSTFISIKKFSTSILITKLASLVILIVSIILIVVLKVSAESPALNKLDYSVPTEARVLSPTNLPMCSIVNDKLTITQMALLNAINNTELTVSDDLYNAFVGDSVVHESFSKTNNVFYSDRIDDTGTKIRTYYAFFGDRVNRTKNQRNVFLATMLDNLMCSFFEKFSSAIPLYGAAKSMFFGNFISSISNMFLRSIGYRRINNLNYYEYSLVLESVIDEIHLYDDANYTELILFGHSQTGTYIQASAEEYDIPAYSFDSIDISETFLSDLVKNISQNVIRFTSESLQSGSTTNQKFIYPHPSLFSNTVNALITTPMGTFCTISAGCADDTRFERLCNSFYGNSTKDKTPYDSLLNQWGRYKLQTTVKIETQSA